MCKQCVTGGREKRARGAKRKWWVCAALVLRDDVYVSIYELQLIESGVSKIVLFGIFLVRVYKNSELLTWLFKLNTSEPVYISTAAQCIIPVSDPECKRYLLKTPLAHQFDRYSKDPDSRRLETVRYLPQLLEQQSFCGFRERGCELTYYFDFDKLELVVTRY